MTITYSTTFRDRVWEGSDNIDLFDGGALKIYTTGLATLLLEYSLATPAFTLTSPGQAVLQGLPLTDDVLADGDAVDYTFEDSGSSVHITGTAEISTVSAGTGSLQINAASVSLTTGQTIEITSAITLTFPATS